MRSTCALHALWRRTAPARCPRSLSRAADRARRRQRAAHRPALTYSMYITHTHGRLQARARDARARTPGALNPKSSRERAYDRSSRSAGRSARANTHHAGRRDPDRIAPAPTHPGATGCRRPRRAGFRSDSGPFDSEAESNSIESRLTDCCGGAGPLPPQFGWGWSGLALGFGVGFGWQHRQLIQNSTRRARARARFRAFVCLLWVWVCLSYDVHVCGARAGLRGRDLARVEDRVDRIRN